MIVFAVTDPPSVLAADRPDQTDRIDFVDYRWSTRCFFRRTGPDQNAGLGPFVLFQAASFGGEAGSMSARQTA